MFCCLGYAVLFVEDMMRTLSFYVDKVGLQVRYQDKGYAELAVEGGKLALLARERAAALVGAANAARPPSGAHEGSITLLVEDVDRVHKELAARGVPFLGAPRDRTWGQRSVFFQDPDGHLIEIASNIPREARTAD